MDKNYNHPYVMPYMIGVKDGFVGAVGFKTEIVNWNIFISKAVIRIRKWYWLDIEWINFFVLLKFLRIYIEGCWS